MSEPVLVLIKAANCGHCKNLSDIWGGISTEIKKSYPHLRYFTVTVASMGEQPDYNSVPRGLAFYMKWYPMILLVPGSLWDAAIANLGPKNSVEIKQGVQVMNTSWIKNAQGLDDLQYSRPPQYDIRKKEDFVLWLKDAMNTNDFKQASSSIVGGMQKSPLVVPTITNPIQPLIPPPVKSSIKPSYALSGDVCAMKLVPRDRR